MYSFAVAFCIEWEGEGGIGLWTFQPVKNVAMSFPPKSQDRNFNFRMAILELEAVGSGLKCVRRSQIKIYTLCNKTYSIHNWVDERFIAHLHEIAASWPEFVICLVLPITH